MLLSVYAGSVNRWECDENDHLNVRFFAHKMQQTLQYGLIESGIATQDTVNQLCRNVVSQHMRHQAEARIAVPMTGMFGVIEADAEHLRVITELRNSATEAVLATYVMDLSGDFSTNNSTNGVELAICPDYAQPRGIEAAPFYLAGESADQLIARGCAVIGRGVIQPDECDADGFMQMFMYMGRNSDSMPNLFARFEGEERGKGVVGGAVLEYRMNRFSHLRQGGRYQLLSGIKSLSEKLQHFVHVLFDVDTGQMVSGSEALAISMDLVERKSIAIPEGRRKLMQGLLLK
ncbi:MAG: acyl-CoA thioester hydrolase [Granulosicoccus sp.]|jgi:acyl-CoA thioester hydrolase